MRTTGTSVDELADDSGVPHRGFFHGFASAGVRLTGHPVAFGLALAVIMVWLVSGPIFGFSDTWQLVINTATTIVTFLMVFLIQNAQNREGEALQLKLAELIRSTKTAHNAFMDLEELSEEELDRIRGNFEQLAQRARRDLRAGKSDLGSPENQNEPGITPGKTNGENHHPGGRRMKTRKVEV